MNSKLEQTFQKIAEDAIERAEQVDCSMKDFYDGLRDISSVIQNRIDVEREEADYLR